MAVLAVDSSSGYAVVGACRGEEVIRESAVPPGPEGRPRHAQVLLPEIERTVEAAGGWDAIERIAVGTGPGSFTGLRIGIATARALAQARELPIVTVGSLAALARGIAESTGAARTVLPVVDARREEVFAALFEGGAERWPPFVASPPQLAERLRELQESPLAAGDGAIRFALELEAVGATVAPPEDPIHRIAARHVCAVGEAATEASPAEVQPLYLRPPDAKRWIERSRVDAAE